MKKTNFKAVSLLGIASGLLVSTSAQAGVGENYLAATNATVQHACPGKHGCPAAKASCKGGCSGRVGCNGRSSCGSTLTADREDSSTKNIPYEDPNTSTKKPGQSNDN